MALEMDMQLDQLKPTTLDGIKRLATRLKRQAGLDHMAALHAAARQAGFADWDHAQHGLATAAPQKRATGSAVGVQATSGLASATATPARYSVEIEARWRTADRRGLERISLTIPLSRPLQQVLPDRTYQHHKKLYAFKRFAEGSIWRERPILGRSEDEALWTARNALCQAANTLRLLDATGLQPSRAYRKFWAQDRQGRILTIPGADHSNALYHPPTGAFVVTDEPFAPAVQGRLPEREAWAAAWGFCVARADWAGIHSPGDTALFLVGREKHLSLLTDLTQRINALPPSLTPGTWPTPAVAMR